MIKTPTYEKIRALKLYAMSRALEEQQEKKEYERLSFEERLGMLVDREYSERENKRLAGRIKQAKFKQQACMEDIDYQQSRNLDKSLIRSFAGCQWIKDKLNILITGLTGSGKTYITSALGHRACLEGYRVLYFRATRLFHDLAIAQGDGSYDRLMNSMAKADLLVIDDFGLSALTDQHRKDFLEILEDRHDIHSTIVASQLPIDHWHEVIGNATLADAILDRLVHNAYKINLKGGSMRRKNSKLK
jgi:DNA replication protein DnaC